MQPQESAERESRTVSSTRSTGRIAREVGGGSVSIVEVTTALRSRIGVVTLTTNAVCTVIDKDRETSAQGDKPHADGERPSTEPSFAPTDMVKVPSFND